MSIPHRYAAWLGLGLLCAVSPAVAQQPVRPAQWPVTVVEPATVRAAPSTASVPLNDIPLRLRQQVREVMAQPTLAATGPTEQFTGALPVYLWLLEHPDRAAQAWRQLGAPCLDITSRGEGRFSWTDGHGSQVRWELVHRGAGIHVWYAEGAVKPGALLPQMPVRVVMVLHHAEVADAQGRTRLEHHAEVWGQTDSKAAALMLRLFGNSAPRMAEQGLGQMEMFFSALTSYLNRHPDKAQGLLW